MLNLLLALTLTGHPGIDPGIKSAPAAHSQLIEGRETAGTKTILFNGQEFRVSVLEVDADLAKALEKALNTSTTPKWLERFLENPELPIEP
jgi:hypothetical protein